MKFEQCLTFRFEASHHLPHMEGRLHGHSYEADVWIAGSIPYDMLERAIEPVRAILDHRHLNDLIEEPTMENIGAFILGFDYGRDLAVIRVVVRRPSLGQAVAVFPG